MMSLLCSKSLDYNNNLSFSMFIDKLNDRNCLNCKNNLNIQFLDTILPRQTHTWTDDKTINNCYICKENFTLFFRKHHCRLCGRIFCYECSKHSVLYLSLDKYQLIDREKYLNFCISPENLKNNNFVKSCRVCIDCKNILKKIKNLSKLIKTFELLSLSIKDYYKIRGVCKEWYNASTIILSRFREIQYKLPNSIYTQFEKTILATNIDSLIGHSKLMKHYIKIIDWNNVSDYKAAEFIENIKFNINSSHKNSYNKFHSKNLLTKSININNSIPNIKYLNCFNNCEYTPCWKLMCGRLCSNRFDDSDVIDILLTVKHDVIRKFILKFLSHDINKLLCYIPILTYCIRLDGPDKPVSNYLLNKSVMYVRFRHIFYWELKVQSCEYKDIYLNILDKIKSNIILNIGYEQYNKFFNDIENINLLFSKHSKNAIINQFNNIINKGENLVIPYNPNITINHLLCDDIRQFDSASKPFLIPYIDDKNYKGGILLKNEDIRKDRIITSIIKLMNTILKSNGLDMNIITYDVLPMSTNSGLIEIIQNSTTIYDIRQKYNKSILNYILEKNKESKISEIRNNFIRSLAGYCIITYLLGIGDRHFDNILIRDDGCLFHIDFSFILGNDPKFFSPEIKITNDMIEALGGENSDGFTEFKNLVYKSYDILRMHSDIIYNLLYLLTKINTQNIDIINLRKEIYNRFLPGEYNSQARLQLKMVIGNSKNCINLTDFFHFHYKENTIGNTIGNGLTNVANTIGKLTSYLYQKKKI